MTMTALLLSLAIQSQVVAKPTVQYYQGEFLIRSTKADLHIPIAAQPPKTRHRGVPKERRLRCLG